MFNRLKLSHRILILVMVPMIFELVLVGRIGQLLSESQVEAERLAHAQAISRVINHILRTMLTSAGGIGAFVVSSQETYMSRSERDSKSYMDSFSELENLTQNDPPTYERVLKMKKLARHGIDVLQKIKSIVHEDERVMAFAEMRKVSPMLATLTAEANEIESQQTSIEEKSPEIQKEQRRQLQWLLMLGAVLNVLLALGLALIFNRGFTSRLKILMDNSYRFAVGVPLNPILTGTDELAKLDEVFHKMAGFIDESARKERAVIENSVEVICSLDAEEKFSKVSQASLNAWGYEPYELVGKRFSEIVFPDEREATRKTIKDLITAMQDKQVECRVVRKDGSVINVQWSMHWSPQEQSLFGVAHDVTEQRRIDRMKQEFVAMVSHDLRTPLTSIKGTLSLLSEGVYDPRSEAGQKRISDAETNINRLVNLIGDVLDIEKLEAGEMSIDKDVVSLVQVVKESIESVRGVAEQNKIDLILKFNQDADFDVLGDNDRLVQVMVNLLSNAIKFSPEKSEIDISVTANGAMNEVRVADHGRGIPSNNLEIVFERFKQIESQDGKRGKGTGLGLAICKAIVEAHEGNIGVESKEGQGSTFWFTVPRYDDPEDLRTNPLQV